VGPGSKGSVWKPSFFHPNLSPVQHLLFLTNSSAYAAHPNPYRLFSFSILGSKFSPYCRRRSSHSAATRPLSRALSSKYLRATRALATPQQQRPLTQAIVALAVRGLIWDLSTFPCAQSNPVESFGASSRTLHVCTAAKGDAVQQNATSHQLSEPPHSAFRWATRTSPHQRHLPNRSLLFPNICHGTGASSQGHTPRSLLANSCWPTQALHSHHP
jgi:hypothetical protein